MKHEESIQQRALVSWAELRYVTEPRLKWLLAIPNGGRRNVITARILKLEGVKAGVSDLLLPVAASNFHGLWIEMKAHNGDVKPKQREFQDDMIAAGYSCIVAYDWVQAQHAICAYLGIDP